MKVTPRNQKIMDEFHAKQGRGVGPYGDHVILVAMKGAKSGDDIMIPLIGGRNGDDFAIVASKGGAPENPLWFANLKQHPEVEVEAPTPGSTEKFRARARIVENRQERDRLFQEMSKIWPAYTDYQARTERVIPVVVLERVK